jgi:hypothetical protein
VLDFFGACRCELTGSKVGVEGATGIVFATSGAVDGVASADGGATGRGSATLGDSSTGGFRIDHRRRGSTGADDAMVVLRWSCM